MIDEKKLIDEIKSCITGNELEGMREKILEIFDQSNNIDFYIRVKSELIKTENRIRRNGWRDDNDR